MTHCVQLTKPTLWFAADSFINKFNQLHPDVKPKIILLENKNGSGIGFAEVLAAGRGRPVQPVGPNPLELVAYILFSSGTTGVPKGVSLTNLNYIVSRKQSQ